VTIHEIIERPTGPTLSPGELLGLARRYALGASDWAARSGAPADRRSYGLLELTDDFEVWAIRWPTEGMLELHDHGGSAGAFFVVEGDLHESFVNPHCGISRRRIPTSSGAAFRPEYLHDVTNLGPVALSVHAYSPPMPAMTFYRVTASGPVALRTEHRSDPSWAP